MARKGRIGDRYRKVSISHEKIRKQNRKEYTKLISMSLFLLILTLSGSYAFFVRTFEANKETQIVSGILKIEYEDKNEINLNNAVPLTDEQGLNTTPYTFTIKNTGSIDGKYTVFLEEKEGNTLDKSNIRYSIKEGNGSWSTPAYLSSGLILKENRVLKSEEEITYQIKIWLKEDVSNEVQAQSYSAKVVINTSQTNSENIVTTNPTINLNGANTVLVEENSLYEELGVSSISSNENLSAENIVMRYEYYDGVTTTNVENIDTSKIGIYYIYYEIEDSNKNKGIATRIVNVYKKDVNIPTITLIGDDTITLDYLQEYIDPFVEAEDIEDGDLTEKVVTVGEVNSKVSGIYIIKYLVVDSSGNTASITRKVIVNKKNGDTTTNIEKIENENISTKIIIAATTENEKMYYAVSSNNAKPSNEEYQEMDKNSSNVFQNEIEIVKNGTYYIYTKDSKGNVKVNEVVVSNIDETKPECTFSKEEYVGLNESVELTLTCTDAADITNSNFKDEYLDIGDKDILDVEISDSNKIDNGYEYLLIVTGKKVGSSTISLLPNKIVDYAGNKNDKLEQEIKVTDIEINTDEIKLDLNENETYNIEVTGTNYGTISYTSSNSNIVSVDNYGTVTGISPGQAIITVEESNAGVAKQVKVIITKTLTVTYEKGVGISLLGATKSTCEVVDDSNTCSVTLPNIEAIDGYSEPTWYNGEIKVGQANELYVISENIGLIANAKANNYTVTYDATDADMESWNKISNTALDIEYDSSTNMNTLTGFGAGGTWEIAYVAISTKIGKEYTLEFDYEIPNDYLPFSTYAGIGYQILTSVNNTSNTDNDIVTKYFPTSKTEKTTTTIEFIATTSVTYIAINLGMANDSATTTMKIGNFKLKESVEYASSYETLYEPIKTGYTFDGWYTEKINGNKVEKDDLVNTANDHTLYAHWTVNSYTVTYDATDADMESWNKISNTALDIEYDSATNMNTLTGYGVKATWEIAYFAISTKVGKEYTLEFDYEIPNDYSPLNADYAGIGYQILSNVNNSNNHENSIVTKTFPTNKTEKTTTTIEFVATTETSYIAINLGYAIDYATTTMKIGNFKLKESVEYASSYETLYEPIKTGYTFDGWYTEKINGNKVEKDDLVKTTSDHTLYAHWTANSYTVTYDYSTNGGSSATKTSQTFTYNEDIDLTPSATKDEFEFVGWNTDKDATTSLSTLKMKSNDIVLYAIYKRNIEITFNKNGAISQTSSSGNTSTDNDMVISCTLYNKGTCKVTSPEIEASSLTPTVIGYSTSSLNHTSEWDTDVEKEVSKNETWYAQTYKAEEIVTITWNANNATIGSTASSCTKSATYNGVEQLGCSITSPTIKRDGYSVVGWGISSTSTSSDWDVETAKTVTTNAIYYAITIDDIAPTCISSGGTDTWLALTQTINGTCSDKGSGCLNDTVSKTYEKTTGYYDGYYSPGTVTDKAGNTTVCDTVQVRVTGNSLSDYVEGTTLLLDGKTGLSDTTWTDQSGKGNNGTLIGATVSDNSVYFSGSTSSYVRIAQMNYSQVTMEVVFKANTITAGSNDQRYIIGNCQNGGYAITQAGSEGLVKFIAYKGQYIYAGNQYITANTMNYAAGRADSTLIKQTLNGQTLTKSDSNAIGTTNSSTYLVLGGNPEGSASTISPFDGYIYAARVYDKVLTDDEIQKNYVIDKSRFDF